MCLIDCRDVLVSDVLDALGGRIAIVDADGTIVAVNEGWKRLAHERGCHDLSDCVGLDFRSFLERTIACGDHEVAALTADVRRVLAGQERKVVAEHHVASPAGTQWLRMTVTRIPRDAGGVVLSLEDVTDRKSSAASIEETAHLRHEVLDALPIGVWLVDAAGNIVETNRAGRAIWRGARYVGPEQFGEYQGWRYPTGEPIEPHEWAAARAIRSGETSIDEEIEIECFDGRRKVILNSAIPLRADDGAICGAIIVNQDVTERVRADAELRRAKEAVETAGRELADVLMRERSLARTDSLTGALNRRRFFELAEYEVAAAVRYERELSIIVFDLDGFKKINDRVGHQAGDELLKGVIGVVRSHLRHGDVLARYGGDEFVVLLPQTHAPEAADIAEDMRSDVAGQSIATAGEIVSTTISAGVAEFLGRGDQLDTMIRRADSALYQAKNEGRNRVIVHGRRTTS